MGLRQVVYVYPDIAFVVSFLMNGLIFWGTAQINKHKVGWRRISLGAFTGALYSFVAAFPGSVLFHGFWVKLLFSLILVVIVFGPLSLKRFGLYLAVFYLVSFALGGMFIGLVFLFNSQNSFLADLSSLITKYYAAGLVGTIVLYLFFVKMGGSIIRRKLTQDIFIIPLRIFMDQSEIDVPALLDTGNRLCDPLSLAPVIIVEYNAMQDIFPLEIQTALAKNLESDLLCLLDTIADTKWSTRFRVIPFSSVGKDKGLLIGFRPDGIAVNNRDSNICTKNVIIGVYHQRLSPEGDYRALLHPDVLEGITA